MLAFALASQSEPDFAAATAEAEQALATTPRSDETVRLSAYVFNMAGDARGAERLLDEALASTPNNPYLLEEKAELHAAAGQWAQTEAAARD